jgi:ketopantoate hydroxymethyltransferase
MRRRKMGLSGGDRRTAGMSTSATTKSILAPDVAARKGGVPPMCLTACTTPMAWIVDAHCDVALVGDSLWMVLRAVINTGRDHGVDDPLHGQAVRRGLSRALLVVDMPFGSNEGPRAQAFRNTARLMADTGCRAVVLEKAPQTLADRITETVAIPTIGIGAWAACDGQILVTEDMLGIVTDLRPKFVMREAELGMEADRAVAAWAAFVGARTFPEPEHVFANAASAPRS